MSREQYQVPTGSGDTVAPRNFDAEPPTVNHYTCGDCAARVRLEKGQPIRCGQCGARVLYKERTKRMVQFEAR